MSLYESSESDIINDINFQCNYSIKENLLPNNIKEPNF